MTVIGTQCMRPQVDEIKSMADHGSMGEVRLQLTAMLRCAGRLNCGQAVFCSDQAVTLLRTLVLPKPKTH